MTLNPNLRLFALSFALISLGCLPLLIPLFRYSSGNTLFSHIFLIPVVSGYLIGLKRNTVDASTAPGRWIGLLPLSLGLLAVFLYMSGGVGEVQDRMALSGFAYVAFVWAAAFFTLGMRNILSLLFPIAFLIAMIPFPIAVEAKIETFLQYGSAEVAYWMFQASGITLYRDGLLFHLPGISLQVAPECSGIRSSLVLLITSLVGGQLFLNSKRNRTLLALFVIPLALVRNGFRVFVLGELCVRVGPHMIDSAIHHQGGPIFFALSLIPFFGFVWLLVRLEKRKKIAGGSLLESKLPPLPAQT